MQETPDLKCKWGVLSFIDSDDFVSKDHIQNLFNLIKNYRADISITDFIYVKNQEIPTQKPRY